MQPNHFIKPFSLLLLILLISYSCADKHVHPNFVSTDINHFWEAYDQIQTTTDSAQQLAYLQELFLDKASPGQKAMIQARNYTTDDYLTAINNYPKFWASIRENTLKANNYARQIQEGIDKLAKLYPDSQPAKVYFTMGTFRSPGTAMDSMVLIGSEFAFGDTQTVTEEFPDNLAHLKDYFALNPIQDLVFLNVHEYVHTQQNPIVPNILCQTLYEGVAEFVTTKTIGPSPSPAIAFGKANEEAVRAKYEEQMFNWRKRNQWLWNDKNNAFQMNDLGYYIGYAICEKNYEKASDKNQALIDMIKLDFNNDSLVESFVDGSQYFTGSLEELFQRFEASRPTITKIQQFENGSQTVDPNLKEITLEFSTPLDSRYQSTGFGDLGKDHFPKVSSKAFAEDGSSITYYLTLEPNKRYQFLLENGYRSPDETPLKPYLVDFTTAGR